MRLIDADAPRKTFVDWLNWYKGSEAVRSIVREAVDILDETPTVDAVPVVRCKDCVFYQPYIQEMYKGKGDCEEHDAMVYDDDFCSYGRKLVKKDGK